MSGPTQEQGIADDGADSHGAASVEAAPPDPTPTAPPSPAEEAVPFPRGSALEVFTAALKLGVTSFGGPIAHLGYFRSEYVARRRWLDDRSYADLVALCQFLPGATSSKVGMSIGILRAGLPGGLAAWLGFTMPSAVALVVVAIFMRGVSGDTVELLHGLKLVAVAVIAQAVWGMAQTLAPDRPRATLALAAAAGVFILPAAFGQLAVIGAAALFGWRFLRSDDQPSDHRVAVPVPRWLSISAWVLLFGLLIGLPVLRSLTASQGVAMFDSFYRSGSLVFGGGHVVLSLLDSEVVPPGWIGDDQFLAGYGFAQAVPGPLFTFASYLGAAFGPAPNGLLGAAIALVAIFLPSVLLTVAALPWWGALRARPAARAALRGVNAAVVGVLLAALYDPVWTTAIHGPADFVLALAAFGLLVFWRCPPWAVCLLTGLGGALVAALR